MSRELGPAKQALSQQQIIALYGDQLEKLANAAQDPQYNFERNILINQARLQWQMVKGNHFTVPGLVDTAFGQQVDYVAFNSQSSDTDNGANVRFCYAINLIGGDCYKFVAVMGNSAPRVKAFADDPQDQEQLDQAQDADAAIRDLWNKWQADRQQRIMAFHQYTTGPTYWRTPWVINRRKYGQTVEPQLGIQQMPDGSTVPAEQGDPRVYPNGDVELHGFTVLEVSHPYMAKDLTACGWFILERLLPKWELLSAYKGEPGPDGQPQAGPLDQYRTQDPPDDDIPSSVMLANEARESVSTPSGTGRQKRENQWRFKEIWLNPEVFELADDAGFRHLLEEQYSDGLYMAKVGKVTVALDNRKVTDEWAVCKTGRGEKILEKPIAADAIPYQRALNDLVNLAIETVLRAIAKTIVDSTLLNRESLAKNEAIPAEVILTTMPVDGDLSKKIAQIPPARVSDQLPPLIMQLRTLWQDNTGIRPELTGGGATTNTYREAKQRKDQALLQLAPQAQEIQYCWEDIGTNGVKMRARFGTGQIKAPRKGAFGNETDVVDMASLSETGWHTEADDNFPITAADRFDKIWGLLKDFPPEVQQALSILDPINLEETLELLQVPGFQSVQEEQKQKTVADIALLLAGQAVDGPPGPDGQPGPKQPSVPVDAYDDHAFVANFLPAWMKSKTGRSQKQQNPQGFDNVVAFWQAHQQMAQPPAPPPPPPVRAGVNFSAKLEDMPPEITNEVLQGAGLPPVPPEQQSPSPNAVAAVAQAQVAPQAVEQQQQPGGDSEQSPIPQLSDAPQGPEPPLLQ